MILYLKDEIGENCITLDDGIIVFDKIFPVLIEGGKVELDFKGVKVYASPFLNAAIGKLLKDLQPETLNKQLNLTNLSAVGRRLLVKVIENAKEYYNDTDAKKAIDDIVAEQSDGE